MDKFVSASLLGGALIFSVLSAQAQDAPALAAAIEVCARDAGSNLALFSETAPVAQPVGNAADFARIDMPAQIGDFQTLAEETLGLREQAIEFLTDLKAAEARGEPLSGAQLRQLNAGAAVLLEQRRSLRALAVRYECWLNVPTPADPAMARAQATGITMSLAAALLLYDNYLTAVGLYRAMPSLRQHLSSNDAISLSQMTEISVDFASAANRSRVRRGLIWYEKRGRPLLADSAHADERYVAALVDQSLSYNMIRRIRPVDYAGNLAGFFGVLSVDTLNHLKTEGVNFFSMVFGNAIGLVELRRGKLDGQADVLARVGGALRAGDILLEKTPFRLTDTFIPGHWGHAAIWIGNESELRELGIWDDPAVQPYQAKIRDGRGVVEALRSGVKMNTLAHFVNVDDLAVLRPRAASLAARREVVLQTLRLVGKSYDFNFDVESTDRIVCSELVYHAYGNIRWPTERRLGRATISPDNVAVLATGDGPFTVTALYHDGREIGEEPGRYLESLVQREVVRLAHGE
ncbi:MAG: hypothetical protein LBE81_04935 [Azonexus sp.]|jgi:uncharacterized protein YycO|uniref:YiiX/YebB-like N1pC/P60 family cysteine hydrolase n=1 Tax=Azonexus sp. TaxID=1872668 RepID=UPI00283497E3|nr:YiiX/YebB-like N1pC/P60 family cysteine hydrolase [Azonexus sp.]MDR0775966.1 hypothetical protein [Azonexus sp.]